MDSLDGLQCNGVRCEEKGALRCTVSAEPLPGTWSVRDSSALQPRYTGTRAARMADALFTPLVISS
jgi:hypothetical protein